MLLQMLSFALVGCVLSLAFDWVMFEQMTLMLRGPSESGDFTYGDSVALRKIAVGIVGALCGAFEAHDFVRYAAIIAWSLLHGYIYLEWKRYQP